MLKEMNMKKLILLTAVILLSATNLVQAQGGELSGTLDLTFLSKYMWRGFKMYGSKSAFQPSLDLDLWGTGLGLNILYSRANASGYELDQELDVGIYYSNSLNEYETYAMDYKVGFLYYYFPQGPVPSSWVPPGYSTNPEYYELYATISFPEICPEGIVPSYTAIRMWPNRTKSIVREIAGWLHVFRLDYDLPIDGILPDTPEQILHLSVETVYNDGVNPTFFPSDSDWSHAVFGVATDFDLGSNLTLRPGVYYQSSWEKDINPSDQLWATVGLSYAF
jgi:hypothetical protein